MLVDAEAGGNGEHTDIVLQAGVGRRDEIRQAVLRLAVGLGTLLAQMTEALDRIVARLVTIDKEIILLAVRGEKAENGFGL